MKLWLQRHAPVLGDASLCAGLCYGATDWPADPARTRTAAQAIAPRLPAGIVLVSSPLRRCTVLADAIAEAVGGAAVRRDARLAEMDFGAWEGQRWDAIDRTALDAWTADFADHRVGGAESVRAFMARVAAAWDAWRADGAETLWVTHAGVIRAAMLLHAGVRCPMRSADWPREALPFGRWWQLER